MPLYAKHASRGQAVSHAVRCSLRPGLPDEVVVARKSGVLELLTEVVDGFETTCEQPLFSRVLSLRAARWSLYQEASDDRSPTSGLAGHDVLVVLSEFATVSFVKACADKMSGAVTFQSISRMSVAAEIVGFRVESMDVDSGLSVLALAGKGHRKAGMVRLLPIGPDCSMNCGDGKLLVIPIDGEIIDIRFVAAAPDTATNSSTGGPPREPHTLRLVTVVVDSAGNPVVYTVGCKVHRNGGGGCPKCHSQHYCSSRCKSRDYPVQLKTRYVDCEKKKGTCRMCDRPAGRWPELEVVPASETAAVESDKAPLPSSATSGSAGSRTTTDENSLKEQKEPCFWSAIPLGEAPPAPRGRVRAGTRLCPTPVPGVAAVTWGGSVGLVSVLPRCNTSLPFSWHALGSGAAPNTVVIGYADENGQTNRGGSGCAVLFAMSNGEITRVSLRVLGTAEASSRGVPNVLIHNVEAAGLLRHGCSTLVSLASGRVFLGAGSGPGSIGQITQAGTYAEVFDQPNAGAILDACIAPPLEASAGDSHGDSLFDGGHPSSPAEADRLFVCCGTGPGSSVRQVRHGIGVYPTPCGVVPFGGATGVWALRGYVLVSFQERTLVLAAELGADGGLEFADVEDAPPTHETSAFDLTSQTVCAAETGNGLILQVRASGIRAVRPWNLVDEDRNSGGAGGSIGMPDDWVPSGSGARISLAAVSGSFVVVVLEPEGIIQLIEAGAPSGGDELSSAGAVKDKESTPPRCRFTELGTLRLPGEKSCLWLGTLPGRADPTVYCVVGAHGRSAEGVVSHAHIYAVDTNTMTLIPAPGCPRSLDLAPLSNEGQGIPESMAFASPGSGAGLRLFVGLRDGFVATFLWTEEAEAAGGHLGPSTSLQGEPNVSVKRCGREPVRLMPLSNGGLLGLGSRSPVVVATRQGRTDITPLAFDSGIAYAAPLMPGTAFGDGAIIAITNDMMLVILEIESHGQLSMLPLLQSNDGAPAAEPAAARKTFRRIAFDPATGLLLALTVPPLSSAGNEMSAVIVIDPSISVQRSSFPLSTGERSCCITPFRGNGQEESIICVGTSLRKGRRGRLVVLHLDGKLGTLRLLGSATYEGGAVFAMCVHENARLLLGVGVGVLVVELSFEPDGSAFTAATVYEIPSLNDAEVSSLSSTGPYISVGDSDHGATIYVLRKIGDALEHEVLTHDPANLPVALRGCAAVAMLDENTACCVDREGGLFVVGADGRNGEGAVAIPDVLAQPYNLATVFDSGIAMRSAQCMCAVCWGFDAAASGSNQRVPGAADGTRNREHQSGSHPDGRCRGAAPGQPPGAHRVRRWWRTPTGEPQHSGENEELLRARDATSRSPSFWIGERAQSVITGCITAGHDAAVPKPIIVPTLDGSILTFSHVDQCLFSDLAEIERAMVDPAANAGAPCRPLLGNTHHEYRSMMGSSAGVLDGEVLKSFETLDDRSKAAVLRSCQAANGLAGQGGDAVTARIAALHFPEHTPL